MPGAIRKISAPLFVSPAVFPDQLPLPSWPTRELLRLQGAGIILPLLVLSDANPLLTPPTTSTSEQFPRHHCHTVLISTTLSGCHCPVHCSLSTCVAVLLCCCVAVAVSLSTVTVSNFHWVGLNCCYADIFK